MQIFESIIGLDNPLLIFVLIGLLGLIGGKIAALFKMPEISGQIITGIIFGNGILHLFTEEHLSLLKEINQIALGVMTFTVGTHLNYKRLHNSSRRILYLAFFDITATFFTVLLCTYFLSGVPLYTALMLAPIAIATAPATIIHLIQKKEARGVLVKTLIAMVALNNVFAIIIFYICKIIAIKIIVPQQVNIFTAFYSSMTDLAISFLLGIIGGALLAFLSKRIHKISQLYTFALLIIFANIAFCISYPQFSYLIICLFTGLVLTNLSPRTNLIVQQFENITGLLFIVFFTMAGVHIEAKYLMIAGFSGAVFILARAAAKTLSVFIGGKIYNFPKKITNYLGPALLPQAGLAVGLVIYVNDSCIFQNSQTASAITAIVLGSVVINEIIGPIAVTRSLKRSDEMFQGNPRLVDFMHEEFILSNLEADDKWDAITKMCKFLTKTNHLRNIDGNELLTKVIEREEQISTGLGCGIAVPHAIIPRSEDLMGVIGILKKPLNFNSLDGEKINVIILIATPKGHEDLHLKLLATVSKIFSQDKQLVLNLTKCANSAEAYDLLQSKEIREINYFLDDFEKI